MSNVGILVEGKTEHAFVTTLLAPYLQPYGVIVTPRIVHTSQSAGHAAQKGGGTWKHYRQDLLALFGATHFACVTTMIDYYAFPEDGPLTNCAEPHVHPDCVDLLELAMANDLNERRFLPFVMLHEFETLVVAASLQRDPSAAGPGVGEALRREAASKSDDVELINDGAMTAPSKRVMDCWPDYDKAVDGVTYLAECDFDQILGSCPHLASWVGTLRALG